MSALALLPVSSAMLWVAVLAGATASAASRARRRGPTRAPSTQAGRSKAAPRVLAIRPCAGATPHLRNALRSTLDARTEGLAIEFLFTVADREDPAMPIALDVAAELRAAGIDVLVKVATPSGPNHKIGQLAAVADPSLDSYDVIVNIDSDVDLRGIDLAALVSPLDAARPGRRDAPCGATWMPPAERADRRFAGLGDLASAALLGGSLHSFPLLAGLDPAGLVGKLFAVDARALARVGGFHDLRFHLGEDMELARRLRAAGYAVTCVSGIAPSLARGRTPSAVVARYARWLMVIRAQRPTLLLSYPLLFAATPLIVLLAALGLPSTPYLSLFTIAAALALRLITAVLASRCAGRPAPSLRAAAIDALLADLLLWAAFISALGPRRVRWRGRTLTIGPSGVLTPGT